MPKPNFYQSLHTTVMGETGQPFEVQIRTREMDLIAERGIAAHWKYKEGRLGPARRRRPLPVAAAARRLAERRLGSAAVPLARSRSTSIPTRSTRSRPRARSSRSPAARRRSTSPTASTPTSGHRCVGARVNGKLVPLRTPLSSGDIVEILTAPNQTPSRDWLSFGRDEPRAPQDPPLHPRRRRSAQAVELGRRLLERELKKYKRTVKKLEADGSLARELRAVGLLASRRTSSRRSATGSSRRGRPSSASCRPRSSRRPEAERRESAVSRVVRKILPFGAPDIVVVGHNDLLAVARQVLQPGAGREDRRLHHARARRLRPLGELPERPQPPLRPGAADRRGLGGREDGRLRDRARGRHGRPAGTARRRDAGDRGRGLEHPPDRGPGRARRGRATSACRSRPRTSSSSRRSWSRIRAVRGVRDVIRKYNVPKAGERE